MREIIAGSGKISDAAPMKLYPAQVLRVSLRFYRGGFDFFFNGGRRGNARLYLTRLDLLVRDVLRKGVYLAMDR